MRRRLRRLSPALLAGLAGCGALRVPQGDPRLAMILEAALPGADISELRPGVALAKRLQEGPLAAHVLAVDLLRADLSFRPILAGDRLEGGPAARETLSSMARRTRALAAVPADYPGDLLHVSGLTVIDGRIHLAPRDPGRSSLVVSRSNRVWIGRFDPSRDEGPDYYQAVGGGPALLKDGAFQWSVDERGRINGEEFSGARADWEARRGWVVAALRNDGRTLLWIVVPGGPAWYSRGASPADLSALLSALGCAQALALQGGAAAALYADGRLASEPPGGGLAEAALGSALGLYALR